MGGKKFFPELIRIIDQLGDTQSSAVARKFAAAREAEVGDLQTRESIFAAADVLRWAAGEIMRRWAWGRNLDLDGETRTPPTEFEELLRLAERVCEPVWPLKKEVANWRFLLQGWTGGKRGWQGFRNSLLDLR